MKTVMRMNGFMTKNELRSVMRVRNRQLSPEERIAAAERIFAAVEMLPAFGRARCVACFCALPDEPPTEAVLRRWSAVRRIVVPRVEGDAMQFYDYRPSALTSGAFGIAEPVVEDCPCVSARGNRFDACARNGIYARRCSAGPRQRLLRSLYGTARVAGFPRRGLFCSPVGRDVADGAARLCDRRGLFRIIARLQRVVLAVQNLLCLAVIKYISVSLLFVLSYILLIFSCLRIFEGGGFLRWKKVLQSLAV